MTPPTLAPPERPDVHRDQERPARPALSRPPRQRQPVRSRQPARSQRDRQEVFARRVRFVRLVLVVVLAVIVLRLVQVQVFRSSHYRAAATGQLTQVVTVPALRGAIYDRYGSVLAMSVPTKNVIADDFQISHPRTEAVQLAPLVGMPVTKVVGLLSRRTGYVVVARGVSVATAAKITTLVLPGITMTDNSQRVVPNGTLAGPILGSLHANGSGASGLEYQYNSLLAGRSGSTTYLESPNGVVLPGTPSVTRSAAHPGTGLELTLDEPLQYTTEQALAAEIVKSHAVSGTAVVMDVKNGDILAMANLTNNATTSGTSRGSTGAASTAATPTGTIPIGPKGPVSEASSNLAVTQVFEPGSVFKIVPFSAALQFGTTTPTTTYTVPDQLFFDGSLFHDATPHPTQILSATQILAQSSNVGTSEITRQLGESRLLAQVGKLGFGKPTGLNFPGEEAGIIAGATQWEPTNYVSLPIGQVDATTALQVLDAFNSVADGGMLVTPRLVRATVDANGSVVHARPSTGYRDMTTTVATELRKMFEQVVDVGTGTSAVVPGYIVAGKTGTAQIPYTGKPGYVPGAFMATFVGFAPARHPVLSAIVVLNRPTPIYGGSVSAPVFSQVMSYALHRYDIPTTPGAPGPGQPQVTGTGAPPAGGAG